MKGFLKRAAVDRARGERVSAPRATLVAIVTGAAAAGLTYRVMRN
jgi:hypothetical protein